MELKEVKRNLNKIVLYNDKQYQLTGCTLRLNDKGYFYQAELKDMKCNSLIICRLDDIGEIQSEIHN